MVGLLRRSYIKVGFIEFESRVSNTCSLLWKSDEDEEASSFTSLSREIC